MASRVIRKGSARYPDEAAAALTGARRDAVSRHPIKWGGSTPGRQGSVARRGSPGPAAQPAPGAGRHQDHLEPRRGDDDCAAVPHGRSPFTRHVTTGACRRLLRRVVSVGKGRRRSIWFSTVLPLLRVNCGRSVACSTLWLGRPTSAGPLSRSNGRRRRCHHQSHDRGTEVVPGTGTAVRGGRTGCLHR
jgi:hypothetical protein